MFGIFRAIWFEVYDLWDGVLTGLGGLLYKMGLYTSTSTTTGGAYLRDDNSAEPHILYQL
jgi:hypothetical protein